MAKALGGLHEMRIDRFARRALGWPHAGAPNSLLPLVIHSRCLVFLCMTMSQYDTG